MSICPSFRALAELAQFSDATFMRAHALRMPCPDSWVLPVQECSLSLPFLCCRPLHDVITTPEMLLCQHKVCSSAATVVLLRTGDACVCLSQDGSDCKCH